MDAKFARTVATLLWIVLLTACGATPTAPVDTQPPSATTATIGTGTYSLTFAMSADCSRDRQAPAVAGSRTYQSAISEASGWQLVSLVGATFAPSTNGYPGTSGFNVISLTRVGDVVTLYFEDPPIWELTAAGDSLLISGHAQGTITDPVTELAFDGEFAGCTAPNHTLTLQRTGP